MKQALRLQSDCDAKESVAAIDGAQSANEILAEFPARQQVRNPAAETNFGRGWLSHLMARFGWFQRDDIAESESAARRLGISVTGVARGGCSSSVSTLRRRRAMSVLGQIPLMQREKGLPH